MEGWLPIMFLAVILKIPVFAGMYIIWWAIRAEPATEEAPGDGDHGFRRWRREPTRPRGPRRGGPHGGGVSEVPPPGRASHPQEAATADPRGRRRRSRRSVRI